MKLDDCGDCKYKKTCLIPEENKQGHRDSDKLTEDQEFEMAVEILKAFNRAGIDYRICPDESFDFRTITDLERASEISQEIQKRY